MHIMIKSQNRVSSQKNILDQREVGQSNLMEFLSLRLGAAIKS